MPSAGLQNLKNNLHATGRRRAVFSLETWAIALVILVFASILWASL